MSVNGIEPGGFTPYVAPAIAPTTSAPSTGAQGVAGAGGEDFGSMVLGGIDKLEGLTDHTDQLAIQAATGDLQSIHDYTIAATQTAVSTQLSVAVRNKAIEAFNDIMRMQI
jgi:flagellar hook-basal body complex protein FliE